MCISFCIYPVRVHLWDLSGSAEYFDVRNELYSGTDAIFLVYDVTNTSSFETLDQWVREVKRYANGDPEIFIVGNKVSSFFFYIDLLLFFNLICS